MTRMNAAEKRRTLDARCVSHVAVAHATIFRRQVTVAIKNGGYELKRLALSRSVPATS